MDENAINGLMDRLDYMNGQIAGLAAIIVSLKTISSEERSAVLSAAENLMSPALIREFSAASPQQGARELLAKMYGGDFLGDPNILDNPNVLKRVERLDVNRW
jgi:hypothetical protein